MTTPLKKISYMFLCIIAAILIGVAFKMFEILTGFGMIVLFPLLQGILIGVMSNIFLDIFKIKVKSSILIFIVVLCLITAGTISIVEYNDFKKEFKNYAMTEEGLTLEEYNEQYEITYLKYWQVKADMGISIGRRSSSLPITGVWVYALSIAELAIMIYFAIKQSRKSQWLTV